MQGYSIQVFHHGDYGPVVPGDDARTLELGRKIGGLPSDYLLVACVGHRRVDGTPGCTWDTMRPIRLGEDHARQLCAQHLVSAHIDDAAKGLCVLDPDLLVGSEEWITSRLEIVRRALDGPVRRRRFLAAV